MATGTPKKENHIICEQCSADAGEPALLHKIYLEEVRSIWESGVTYQCPRGHTVQLPSETPPPAA
jgi:hypothetical protein